MGLQIARTDQNGLGSCWAVLQVGTLSRLRPRHGTRWSLSVSFYHLNAILFKRFIGTVRLSVYGGRFTDQAWALTNCSPKRMANCALAMVH
jgi:hypothetical protein